MLTQVAEGSHSEPCQSPSALAIVSRTLTSLSGHGYECSLVLVLASDPRIVAAPARRRGRTNGERTQCLGADWHVESEQGELLVGGHSNNRYFRVVHERKRHGGH